MAVESGSSCSQSADELEHLQISDRMQNIKHTLVVLSGKGGVGKTPLRLILQ